MKTIFIKVQKNNPSVIPASIALSVELDNMISDLEIELLGQTTLSPTQQFDLIVDKISIIDHATAICADKMMMMPDSLRPLRQLIPCPAIAEVEFENEAHMHKQLQGAVHGREPDIGLDLMHGKIHVFSAQMLLSIAQHIKDCFSSNRDPITATAEPTVPPGWSWITSPHFSTPIDPSNQSYSHRKSKTKLN
jgi:hypothetical protein